MTCFQLLHLLFANGVISLAAAAASDYASCAGSEQSIEKQENQEWESAQMELLQFGTQKPSYRVLAREMEHPQFASRDLKGDHPPLKSLGGDHRYLLVRPCARFAGDGWSGLPRHLVTGECCGDAVCSTAKFEDFENCPEDCKGTSPSDDIQKSHNSTSAISPPTETSLFGTLEGMEHDEYHCSDEGEYQTKCSYDRNYSVWLESLLAREKNGTLPFDLPPPGSVAVEFGCGRGQDSRNIASMAGYALTAVDVSPSAIEMAKNSTAPEMLGTGPGHIEFVSYDAMALPVPKQRVDFFFDATVYCGLRHEYLSKLYGVWSRLLTPGHTLVFIQCWNWERQGGEVYPVPRTERDMHADFEPVFDILHSEACEKNQDGPGWCFYMKLKAPEAREFKEANRLKIQQAARSGDIEYVRQNLEARSEWVGDAELKTLYYIARSNQQTSILQYLSSSFPKHDDAVLQTVYTKLGEAEDQVDFETVYGPHAEVATVEAEDQIDGASSVAARKELSYLKADWEKAEAALIRQARAHELEK